MGYVFSKQSLSKFAGVNPKLVEVAKRALSISEVDFGISEGLRTLERQKQLLSEKKTQTLKSYHLQGKAIDVVAYVDGTISWEWSLYEKISKAFKQAASELGVKITWGGDWKSFKDGPHFQLEE